MKKIKTVLLFIMLIAVGLFAYKLNIDMKKELSRSALDEEAIQAEYSKVKSKVDDTAIIRKAMKAIGIMGLLEGHEDYKQLIEEENWYSYRGININWHYRFSIAMNLDDVDVNAANGAVNISIDNKKLFIWFIEKSKDSTSHSEASLLAKKYSSQELNALEKAVGEKIENKIKGTEVYWEKARKSLEDNLTRLCNDLGYYNVEFSGHEKVSLPQ